MKAIFGFVLLTSLSAFAQEFDATDALLNILPSRDYSGRTEQGNFCQVAVRNLGSKVVITVTSNGFSKRSEVSRGAVYRSNPGNRSFLATTVNGPRENIFRTIAVSDRGQYVVVSDVVSNNRDHSESIAECIINL